MSEKCILVELIDAYKDSLENKRTDAVTAKMKEEAWKLLAVDFNSQSTSGVIRGPDQLRICWMNLKKSLRIKLSKDKIDLYKTGGGPPVDLKLDDLENRILSICSGQFNPLQNEMDDDTGYHIIELHMDSEQTQSVFNIIPQEKSTQFQDVQKQRMELNTVQISKPGASSASQSVAHTSGQTSTEEVTISSGVRKPFFSTPAKKKHKVTDTTTDLSYIVQKNQQLTEKKVCLMETREKQSSEYRAAEECRAVAQEKRAVELHELICIEKRLDIKIKQAQLRQLMNTMPPASDSDLPLQQPNLPQQPKPYKLEPAARATASQSQDPRQIVVLKKMVRREKSPEFSL